MKTLLTIIPFYIFTSAFGQIMGRVTSVQSDTVKVSVMYLNGYKLTGATNLWGPAAYGNNNTIFTGSGIDWLMSNHPYVLQLRSDLDKVIARPVPVIDTAAMRQLRIDLDKVIADAARLKADNTALATENVKLRADIGKLQTDVPKIKSNVTKLNDITDNMLISIDSLSYDVQMIKAAMDTTKTIIDMQQKDIQILKTDSLNSVYIKLGKTQKVTGKGTLSSPFVIK